MFTKLDGGIDWAELAKWLFSPLKAGVGSTEISEAYHAIRRALPEPHDPPNDADVGEADRAYVRFGWRKIFALAAFASLSAFGAFYAVRPDRAFRLAAHLALGAAPIAWVWSAGAFIWLRQKQQFALTVRTAWQRWRDRRLGKISE